VIDRGQWFGPTYKLGRLRLLHHARSSCAVAAGPQDRIARAGQAVSIEVVQARRTHLVTDCPQARPALP
jgi:hypothetical protein